MARVDAAMPTTYVDRHDPAEETFSGRPLNRQHRPAYDSASPTEVERSQDSDLTSGYTVTGTEDRWYQDWRAALDPVARKIVDKTLERVEVDGHCGDWRKLTGVGAYYEIRVHYGAGQRIYYRFTGPTSIEVVAAGKKSEQQQILRRLSMR